jgi:hypothetical protein
LWFIIRFKKSETKRGKNVFDEAVSLEESEKFADACFHYAVASNAGYQTEACKRKIRELWRAHGPFDFSEQQKKLQNEFCRDTSCGEGFHHLTVSDIHKWVNEENA